MYEYLNFFLLQLISKVGKLIFEIAPVLMMSAAAYGNYVYLLSIGIITIGLATFGMPISLLRLVPEWKKNTPGRNISFAVWDVYILSFLTVSIILYLFLIDTYTPTVVGIFIFFIFLYGTINIFPNIYRALMQIKKWFFYQEVLLPLISAGIVIVLLINYYKTEVITLQHMVITMAVSSLIATAFMYKSLKRFYGKFIKIRWPLNKNSLDVLKVSAPLMFTSFSYLLLSRIDIVMLEKYIQSDILGVYNILARVSFQALFVWQIISAYYMPKISNAFLDKDINIIKILHRQYLILSLISTILISLIFIAFVNFNDMKEYTNLWSSDLLISIYILLIAQIFSVIFSGYGYILLYIHKEKFAYVNSVVMIVIAVVANILLIPEYGVVGASLATLFAIVFVKLLELMEVLILKKTVYL
jgi:O-antigen/teichoic acid export membrane protein